MFDRLKGSFGGRANTPACAVVTPVGPGHEELYRECRVSVEEAWRFSHGPFSRIEHIGVDDASGRHGRSRARNIGTQRAAEQGLDWVFFLDADDLLARNAFEDVGPYTAEYDAIWGLICGLSSGASEPHLRLPQIITLNSLDELILFDPFLTLQMGHFVRTRVALEVRFDETMNAGEDFDYYLRLWQDHRCGKVNKIFFINQHSRQSTGPRAASAKEWGVAVRDRLREARTSRRLLTPTARMLELQNARIAEVQRYFRDHQISGCGDVQSLSRQLPYQGHFDVLDYEGEPFVLYTNNDDLACASLAWTGEYNTFACGLWQHLAKSAHVIFDVGARHGFFGLLAARAARGAQIHCFEPSCERYARMRLNFSLNECVELRAIHAAVADLERAVLPASGGESATQDPENPGGARIDREPCRALQIDAYADRMGIERIDLIRINAGGGALRVLQGMEGSIDKFRPDLLFRVHCDSDAASAGAWLAARGYVLYVLREAQMEIEVASGFPAAHGAREHYCLASTRGGKEIAQLARACLGRPVNFG